MQTFNRRQKPEPPAHKCDQGFLVVLRSRRAVQNTRDFAKQFLASLAFVCAAKILLMKLTKTYVNCKTR